MAVIYRITNMANGKYYIGSAELFARREWQHKTDLKRGVHKNPRLQAAWNKYGADMFIFEVLEVVPDGESTFDWENRYLHIHVGLANCYNVNTDAIGMRTGIKHRPESKIKMAAKVQAALAEGRGGKFIPSEETRRKMSEANKGKPGPKGHIRTEEHRRNLSKANKGNQNWLGKRHSEESKLKMSKRILEVSTNTEFTSLSAALKHYTMTMPTLRRALLSDAPITKGRFAGLQFKYVDTQQLSW
jgi:group I intron endonuclease